MRDYTKIKAWERADDGTWTRWEESLAEHAEVAERCFVLSELGGANSDK